MVLLILGSKGEASLIFPSPLLLKNVLFKKGTPQDTIHIVMSFMTTWTWHCQEVARLGVLLLMCISSYVARGGGQSTWQIVGFFVHVVKLPLWEGGFRCWVNYCYYSTNHCHFFLHDCDFGAVSTMKFLTCWSKTNKWNKWYTPSRYAVSM